MEELFLGRILASDELNVIDHQHIDRTEDGFEIHNLLRRAAAWTKRYMNCSAER